MHVAILLHAAGPDAQEVHSQFKVDTGEIQNSDDWPQELCVSGADADVTFKFDYGAQGNVLPVFSYHHVWW